MKKIAKYREGAILSLFFLHAFLLGAFFSRIPEIQASAAMSKAELGFVMLGQPLGAIVVFLFGPILIARRGTKTVLSVAMPLLAVTVFLISLLTSFEGLWVSFIAYGASVAIANICINVEANRFEQETSRRIMNRCHALWSIGFLATSLLGTAAQSRDLGLTQHLAVVTMVAFALTTVVLQGLPPTAALAGKATQKKQVVVLPTIAVALLVGYLIGSLVIETAVKNWSVIFMREAFDMPAWIGTLALPAFLVTQASGRWFADGWVSKFGTKNVAILSILSALAGLALVCLLHQIVAVLLGFALIGLGVCVAAPLAMSAAANLGDRPAAENVASMTLLVQLTMLGTPAALGFVAEYLGTRGMFLSVAPLMLMGAFFVKSAFQSSASFGVAKS